MIYPERSVHIAGDRPGKPVRRLGAPRWRLWSITPLYRSDEATKVLGKNRGTGDEREEKKRHVKKQEKVRLNYNFRLHLPSFPYYP